MRPETQVYVRGWKRQRLYYNTHINLFQPPWPNGCYWKKGEVQNSLRKFLMEELIKLNSRVGEKLVFKITLS